MLDYRHSGQARKVDVQYCEVECPGGQRKTGFITIVRAVNYMSGLMKNALETEYQRSICIADKNFHVALEGLLK